MLLSLCCSGSTEKVVPCFNCVWLFEFEIVDVNFLSSELLFRKSFFSRWWIIYVQLFSNVIFALAQDFTSNVELRSKDYNHFCYKLREVRHLEKDFGFEAVWELRYCFMTWFWAQLTCTTSDWFNWNCAFWRECKKAPFSVRYFSELLNLRSFVFHNGLWIQTCRSILQAKLEL